MLPCVDEDGDARVAALVSGPFADAASERGHASPACVRWVALGAALGFVVGMALGAFAVMRVIESHLERMEMRLTQERTYE